MAKLDLHPGVYNSGPRFRSVIRAYRNGKPHGSKAAPFTFASREGAYAHARNVAQVIATKFTGEALTVHAH
jgi:hypothetical protein